MSSFDQLYRHLYDSLKNQPEDWKLCVYTDEDVTIDHKSGVRLWMHNGFLHFRIYEPRGIRLGIYWSYVLYPLARKVMRNMQEAKKEALAETVLKQFTQSL